MARHDLPTLLAPTRTIFADVYRTVEDSTAVPSTTVVSICQTRTTRLHSPSVARRVDVRSNARPANQWLSVDSPRILSSTFAVSTHVAVDHNRTDSSRDFDANSRPSGENSKLVIAAVCASRIVFSAPISVSKTCTVRRDVPHAIKQPSSDQLTALNSPMTPLNEQTTCPDATFNNAKFFPHAQAKCFPSLDQARRSARLLLVRF